MTKKGRMKENEMKSEPERDKEGKAMGKKGNERKKERCRKMKEREDYTVLVAHIG